jgi:hypothetical protein
MVMEMKIVDLVEENAAAPKVYSYALIERATGIVTNMILWDGINDWTPEEGFFVIQSDVPQIGWTYEDGEFFAPPVAPPVPPTAAEILSANTYRRNSLLAAATLAIDPLQDAVDLDMATDADLVMLKAWKLYRVNVNRVDLKVLTPAWPTQPV